MSKFVVAAAVLLLAVQQAAGVANIAETFVGGNDRDGIVERFNKWMDDVGCDSKVETAYIPGFRLGLVAREPITQGEVYLAVPWMSLVHEESILASPTGPQFAQLKRKYELDTFHFLMLFFLRELDQADSYWRPFLDILPASLNTPIFWEDELLDTLVGTKVPTEARAYRSTAKANFEKDHKIISDNIDIFGQEVLDKLTFDRYLWASNVLDSRTIWVDGRYRVMLPVLDMANNRDHLSRAHRTVRNTATAMSNTPAIWDVAKGEQLFENYNTPNFENLLYHGFVLTENSHETVVLQMPAPSTDYYQSLHAVGARPKYTIPVNTSLSKSVFAHARVVTQPVETLSTDPTEYLQPGNALGEFTALRFLEHVLQQHLAAFASGTTRAGDKALLESETLSDDLRTAITYRVLQRGIFEDVLAQVTELKTSLETAARQLASNNKNGDDEPATEKKRKQEEPTNDEL